MSWKVGKRGSFTAMVFLIVPNDVGPRGALWEPWDHDRGCARRWSFTNKGSVFRELEQAVAAALVVGGEVVEGDW